MPQQPKPTRLRLLEGNPGKQKINRDEPQPQRVSELDAPKHLDKRAKAMWKVLSAELDRLGLLTVIDCAALEGACVAYSRAVEAELQIQEKGLTIGGVNKTGGEYVVANPLVAVAQGARKQYLEFCREFGCTPSSRTRLQVGGMKELSLEEILAS